MIRTLFLTTLAAAVCIGLSGCAPESKTSSPDSGEHAHGDEGEHAHGDQEGHEHDDEGPHGGCLIELEDGKYHAEMVHDDEAGSVTVYLLDVDSDQPLAADTPELTLQILAGGQFVDYVLKAAPDSQAATSFSLVDEALCNALDETEEVSGRIHVVIQGETCSGDIKHATHDHDEDGDHHDDEDGHDHHDDGHHADDEDGHDHDEDGHHDDDDEDGHDHDEDGHDHDEEEDHS